MITDQLTHCPICSSQIIAGRSAQEDPILKCGRDADHIWGWYHNDKVVNGLCAINIRYDKFQFHWKLSDPVFTSIWQCTGPFNARSSDFSHPLAKLDFLMDIPRDKDVLEQRLKTLLTFS